MIAESVYPISYADLRENGGPYKLTRDAEAVIAIPSYNVSAKATQGPARPVYVISEDEVSWRGGPFKVIQSQNARVVKFVPGGLGAPHPEGRRNYQAQPVYVVGGTSDHYLKLLRLFGRSIIGYWPMWEQAPSVYAFDQTRNKFHGLYKNVTLGQPGIGDGRTSALFNGSTSFVQLPLGFMSAFNGLEGTISLFFRVLNIGVWTDGVARQAIQIFVDASNRIWIQKQAAANSLQFNYTAGGTVKAASITLSSTAWVNLSITWSKSASVTGQVKNYLNGIQQGATLTGLGAWVGVPVSPSTVIGAINNVPANVTSGYLSDVLALNRSATKDEMAIAGVFP